MHVSKIEIDSQAFGFAVLAIHDLDIHADFAGFESGYLKDHRPGYVSCKLPLGDLRGIHFLESAGFQLVEVQLTGDLTVRARDTGTLPYAFEKVSSEEVMEEICGIAATAFELDRYSLDPGIGHRLSGLRYQQYVRKSFYADDEEVCRLFDPATGKTLAFKSHKRLSSTQALVLLSAVRDDQRGGGLGFIADDYYFNHFLEKGVMRLTTSCSAEHRIIMQHLIGNLRMRVRATSAILRKLYPAHNPPSPTP